MTAGTLILIALTLFSNGVSRDNDKPSVTAEQLAGCYELTLSEWKPALNLGEDLPFITPPSSIQLRLEHGTAGFEKEKWLLRPAPGVKPSIHRVSWWEVKGAKVLLVWSTGFAGLSMELNPTNAGFEGTASSFWDFGRPRQKSHVTAKRIPCAG